MNIEQAKPLSIVDYLAWRGFHPVKTHGRELFYLSPLRADSTPSFSVNPEKNVWSDKGLPGERGQKFLGGAIHQLAERLCGSMSAGLADLAKFSGHKSPTTNPITYEPKPTEGIRINNYRLIEHKALCTYIESRKTSLKIARLHCHEVWYRNGSERKYFACGLRNQSGGWELSAHGFKACSAPKDITIIRYQDKRKRVLVFEGMFDMLSYMTLVDQRKIKNEGKGIGFSDIDWLCLNSTAMVDRAIPYLREYQRVDLYLDNDDAGNAATTAIKSYCPNAVDHRSNYQGYNDVNEWLCRETI